MGTWRVADVDRVMAVIQALNEVEWPQTRETVRDLLEGFGWTSTPKGLGMLSNLGVAPGVATLPAVKDELTRVGFTICDVFSEDDLEKKADFLQDAFADYAADFRRLWGLPIASLSAPTQEIWWSLGNDCVIKIKRTPNALKVEFATPLGVSIDKIPDVRL